MANLEATFIAPDSHPTTAGALRALVAEMFADAAGARSGRLRGMAAVPAAPDAGFAVTVGEGSAIVGADDGLGAYFVAQYAPETIPWIPAGGQPRIDSLVLAVADSDYGTIPASLGPVWRVVEGVAAASPVALSDADLAAKLGTPGGHVRWTDVQIPPAPQEAITGNLMTNRAAEVRASKLASVTVVDLGQENLPPTVGDMLNVSTASITVPSSGRVKVTLRAFLWGVAGAYSRFGYRVSGGATIPYDGNDAMISNTAGVTSQTISNVHEGLTPGATITCRAVGVTASTGQVSAVRWLLEQLP